MNPLHLGGCGVEILTSNPRPRAELKITEITVGRKTNPTPVRYQFLPRRIDYDSIILENATGQISLAALRWLSKHNLPIFFLDFDSSIISSILPPTPVKADLRVLQIQAATNPQSKLAIAKAFVQGKLNRSLKVLTWLSERYDIQEELRAAKGEAVKALQTQTVNELRTVEGRTALRYWEALRKILPESLRFKGRVTATHNENATDPFNACLNYSYGFVKVACRIAINTMLAARSFLERTDAIKKVYDRRTISTSVVCVGTS